MTLMMSLYAPGKRYRLMRRPRDIIRPSEPRAERRDCHGRLLTALLDRAGKGWSIGDTGMTGWASATFVGARHAMTLLLVGDGAEDDAQAQARAFGDALPEMEFILPGHIVADLAVESVEEVAEGIALQLSVLTIETW